LSFYSAVAPHTVTRVLARHERSFPPFPILEERISHSPLRQCGWRRQPRWQSLRRPFRPALNAEPLLVVLELGVATQLRDADACSSGRCGLSPVQVGHDVEHNLCLFRKGPLLRLGGLRPALWQRGHGAPARVDQLSLADAQTI
jgi:hypothetical protein